jgi:mannan endo-1,4-beta-mannosidase
MKSAKIQLIQFTVIFTLLFANYSIAADGFSIKGTKLLDSYGNEFIIRGVSCPFAWYDGNSYNSLPTLASLKCNTIRIVMTTGTSSSRMDQIIQRCIQLNMIAIPELHDATGNDNESALLNCANYWARSDVKAVLEKHRKYVIVNIANEWMGTWGKNTEWKAAYKKALNIMRKAGIKNTILIDAGGWGQDYKYISNNGIEVFEADTLKNTFFAIHMYGQYSTATKVQTAYHELIGKGIPFIIGEFGWKHSDGDVDELSILKESQEHGIGYIAWSWKGNGGGVEYLDLSSNWTSASLTDWGKTVFQSENGITKTSRTCSVFTGGTVGIKRDITLSVNLRLNSQNSINTYSIAGRRILSNMKNQVGLSNNLSGGVYLMSSQSDNGTVQVKKNIIQY